MSLIFFLQAATIAEDLPALLDRKHASPKTFEVKDNGVMDSLGTVFGQEMDRFNKLLVTISK